MKKLNISDRELFEGFQKVDPNTLVVEGHWVKTITRADGTEEVDHLKNIVTAEGLNALASRGVADTTSAFAYLAVGTLSGASSLGTIQNSGSANFGEVSRKTPTTITSSKETMFSVMTWAGAADSVTSLALESAAMLNHASSGQGALLNVVNGLGTTLADSDFLKLEVQVRVGSHAI